MSERNGPATELAARNRTRILRRRDVGGGMADDGEAAEHYGYEVEYAVPTTPGDRDASSVRKCSHPSARDYTTESEIGTGTRHPTLVVLDEEGEAIASYNGLIWLAIRKMAKPAAASALIPPATTL